MTIAVRTLENGTDVLNWVLSDHLRSTSTTANADGSLKSIIQYTAFGEIRLTQGNTPTKYRYTGQLAQAELGLDYYVARWYDPLLGHFTSADTIIPEPGKASAFDRYAYVSNNPIRMIDPSGHSDTGACGPGEDCKSKTKEPPVCKPGEICKKEAKQPDPLNKIHTEEPTSHVVGLIFLGIIHAPSATVVGEGLQSLREDPSLKAAKDRLITKIREKPQYGKTAYTYDKIESTNFTANGPDKQWTSGFKNGNQAFFMVHTGTLSATNVQVYADGTISARWIIEDQFDYLPDWVGRIDDLFENPGSYFAYNVGAELVSSIYHDRLGADPYPTNAYWNEITPPEYNSLPQ
jgi:RHS repeat-associated protein